VMREPILDIFISDDEEEAKYSFFEMCSENEDIQMMIRSTAGERSMGIEPFVEASFINGRKEMAKTIFYTIIRPIEEAKLNSEDADSSDIEITKETYDGYLNSETFVSLAPYGIGVQLECSNFLWLFEILSVEPDIHQFIKDIFEQKEISMVIPDGN